MKLSALAVRLEKPFKVLICRYWHCDSKIFIERRISFADLGREGIFSLARVESLGVFLELDASAIVLLRVVHWSRVFHPPRHGFFVGRDLQL